MAQPALAHELSEDLAQTFRSAWTQIVEEQARILNDPSRFRRAARLRELRGEVESLMGQVDSTSRAWVQNQLRTVYRAGGLAGQVAHDFSWTQTHLHALATLQRDTMGSVLSATRYVRRDTKRFIREMSKSTILNKIVTGQTAQQAGKTIEKLLKERGIAAITYKDGSRHGLAEYGQMLARTKSAEAYNLGTIKQSAQDCKWWEILDGPECGLVFHDDGDIADGKIVDEATAEKYLISHPQCRRSFGPRPDLNSKKDPGGSRRPSTTAAQRKDIKQADRVRRELKTKTRAQKSVSRTQKHARTIKSELKTPESIVHGERIRDLREATGMSRPELSEKTGISVAKLHGIEHGRPVTADELARLERALGPTRTGVPAPRPAPTPTPRPTPTPPKPSPFTDRRVGDTDSAAFFGLKDFSIDGKTMNVPGDFGPTSLWHDLVGKEGEKLRDLYVVDDDATLRLNKALREGRATASQEAKAKRLDDFIARGTLDEDGMVFRGAVLDDDTLASLQPGARMVNKGFQSTGQEDIARTYVNARARDTAGNRVIFDIEAKAGQNFGVMDGTEWVLPRNTEMRVISRSVDKDGITHVRVELNPAKAPTPAPGSTIVKPKPKSGGGPGGAADARGGIDVAPGPGKFQGMSARSMDEHFLAKYHIRTAFNEWGSREAAAEAANTFDQLLTRFPQVRPMLTRAVQWKPNLGGNPNASATFYSRQLRGGTDHYTQLQFNTEHARLNAVQYARRFSKVADRGWWVPESSNVGGTIAHEFGHAMRFVEDDLFSVTQRVIGALKEVAPDVKFGISTARGGFNPATSQWIKQNVSQYAASNIEELIAESFSEVVRLGNAARPGARAVYNALMSRR